MNPFEEANRRPNRERCSVAKLLDQLDPERSGYLRDALAAPHIMHSTITRVLKEWGHPVAPQTVGRHRTGTCSCDPER